MRTYWLKGKQGMDELEQGPNKYDDAEARSEADLINRASPTPAPEEIYDSSKPQQGLLRQQMSVGGRRLPRDDEEPAVVAAAAAEAAAAAATVAAAAAAAGESDNDMSSGGPKSAPLE